MTRAKLTAPPRPTRADKRAAIEVADARARARDAVRYAASAQSEARLLAEVRRAVKRARGSALLSFHERESVGAQVLADLIGAAHDAAPTLARVPVPMVVERDARPPFEVTRASLERSASYLIGGRTDQRSASSARGGWVDVIGRTVPLDAPAPDADDDAATIGDKLAAPVPVDLAPVDLIGADVDQVARKLADILTVPDRHGEPRTLTGAERRAVHVAVTLAATGRRRSDDAVTVRAAMTATRSPNAVNADQRRGRALLGQALATPDDARRAVYRAATLAGVRANADDAPTRARTAPLAAPTGRPAQVLAAYDAGERRLALAGAIRRLDPGARTIGQARALGAVLACVRAPLPVPPRKLAPWTLREARDQVEGESAKLGAYLPDGDDARPVARPDQPAEGRAHYPLACRGYKPTPLRGEGHRYAGRPRPILAPRPLPAPAPVTVRRVCPSWLVGVDLTR